MSRPAAQPESRTQRLLLDLLLVGAACAAVLAVTGVAMVLAAVLAAVPVAVLVLVGAAVGLIAWRALG